MTFLNLVVLFLETIELIIVSQILILRPDLPHTNPSCETNLVSESKSEKQFRKGVSPGDRHEYLGFVCDTKLSGKGHWETGTGKARGMSQKLSILAKTISEEAALAHLETNTAPAATYAMELVRDPKAPLALRQTFTDAV